MRKRFKRYLPNPEKVRHSRWIRWLGPALHHPRLWHLSRRGIALGCALGMFYGILIPVGQIPLAAGSAVVLRANIPAAVVSTLVSNPVSFGPIYYCAYRLGEMLTGEKARVVPPPETQEHETGLSGRLKSWWHRLDTMGKPLIVGLGFMSVTLSFLTYVTISTIWRVTTVLAWRRRIRKGRKPPRDPPPS